MEIKTLDEINSKTPGLCINTSGEIICMDKSDYHRTFFSSLLSDLSGVDNIKEDNLAILINALVNDYNQVLYQGCSEGDRNYSGGFMFIKDESSLTDEQLNTAISLFSKINSEYDVDIIKINPSEEEISIGEVYEEYCKRGQTHQVK